MKVKTFEDFINESVQFKVEDGDVIEISIYDDEQIGFAHLERFFDYNFDLEDVMSEEEFDEYFDDYNYISLRHMEIDDYYKGMGFGRKLMEKVINWCRKNGYKQLYLNASPMGTQGLQHNKLVEFYKKFGFKVIKRQQHNTIMILDL